MAITKIHVCDFIIWTPNDITIETIAFNEKFWIEKCYPYLENFYFDFILPEIILNTLRNPVIIHLISILIFSEFKGCVNFTFCPLQASYCINANKSNTCNKNYLLHRGVSNIHSIAQTKNN